MSQSYDALKAAFERYRAEAARQPKRPAKTETLEQMAERGKRDALRVALEGLADAKTPAEKSGAVGAMATALKMSGMDGAQADNNSSPPVFQIEFLGTSDLTPAAKQEGSVSRLAIRTESEEAGRQADAVSAVAPNEQDPKPGSRRRSA